MKNVAKNAKAKSAPIIVNIIVILPFTGTFVTGSGEAKAVNPKPAHPAKICAMAHKNPVTVGSPMG